MKFLQVCPPHMSDVATVPWAIQKVNSIIHTYFWLAYISIYVISEENNSNPLAHLTWKCHHTNLWSAKLFHPTEGLWRSFKRWRPVEPVVDCRRWLWKEPAVMCGNWNVRQATQQQVFRVTTFCINTCFQSFFDTQSHSTPRCAEIHLMSQQTMRQYAYRLWCPERR